MRKRGKRRRGRELKKKKGMQYCGLVGSSSMVDTKIGMSRITAGINERGGVCCWTVYSLLIGYKSVPGLDGQVEGRYHLSITHMAP